MSHNLSSTTDQLSNLTTCQWCLSEQLVGPIITVFVSIEFVLSLLANSFIFIQTLRNGCKMLKKSSTLLLFNLALSNLLITTLYMPFVIISTAAEEWIIGSSDAIRKGFCEFNGFMYAYASSLSVHTIAAISFDRSLSIVRPHLYQRFMTWKTALGIVLFIWVSFKIVFLTATFSLICLYSFISGVNITTESSV